MTWLMAILRICQEKQLLIKYYMQAFNIAKNAKYDGYQGAVASIVYRFFNKKSSGVLLFRNNN